MSLADTAPLFVNATKAAAPRRLRLLGGEVDLVTPAEVMAFTAAAVTAKRPAIVANHNLHSLHQTRRDPAMQAFYAAADLIEADSTPLIAWGALLGRPIRRRHRATYLDWRELFWAEACRRGWRVFYLGGAPGVAERGASAIRERWPRARVGAADGYFEPGSAGDASRLETIRNFRPDVLFVGMGMPRQERWVVENRAALPVCVTFNVGAAFDYEAGAQATPPRWTGRLGVEWLWRLVGDPRRMARRYLLEPWTLIPAAIGDVGRTITRG